MYELALNVICNICNVLLSSYKCMWHELCFFYFLLIYFFYSDGLFLQMVLTNCPLDYRKLIMTLPAFITIMGFIQDWKLLEMDMSNDLSLSFAKKNLYLLLKNDDLGGVCGIGKWCGLASDLCLQRSTKNLVS